MGQTTSHSPPPKPPNSKHPQFSNFQCSHFAHAPLPILTPRQLNKFPREEPKKLIFDSYIICKNLFSAKRVSLINFHGISMFAD
jgi:hypothetical protein